ncbi:MAG: hypothetical protein ABIQ35_03085 [Verrucomicrobiota bacterium]
MNQTVTNADGSITINLPPQRTVGFDMPNPALLLGAGTILFFVILFLVRGIFRKS